ncbi:unnamed protein product, partial [Allacma fusca]
KTSLKTHLNDCPGNPSDDVTETFKYPGGLVYDKREHIWVNIKKMVVYENISPDKQDYETTCSRRSHCRQLGL